MARLTWKETTEAVDRLSTPEKRQLLRRIVGQALKRLALSDPHTVDHEELRADVEHLRDALGIRLQDLEQAVEANRSPSFRAWQRLANEARRDRGAWAREALGLLDELDGQVEGELAKRLRDLVFRGEATWGRLPRAVAS